MNKQGPTKRQNLGSWMRGIRGRIEATLSAMLEKEVTLTFEEPRKIKSRDFDALLEGGPVAISLHFGPESGWHLLLPQALAGSISDLASMGDGTAGFDIETHSTTLQEIFGQVEADLEPELSAVMGSSVEFSTIEVSISPDTLITRVGSNPAIVGSFQIEGFNDSPIIIMFEMGFAMQFSTAENEEEVAAPPSAKGKQAATPQHEERPPAPQRQQADPVARPVAFEDFGHVQPHKTEKNGQNIDSLLDISLPIIIELGRAKMLIREVLDLGPGSVIELDKLSGEPVDLYVNDKKFARGEVVVIEENFGVRITELIKVEDRLKALK